MSDTFVFPASIVPSLPIEGTSARFPVHRIYCIGRNYGEHVREMGGDPKDQPPIFFMKPSGAVVASGEAVPYPSATGSLHHEIELVVALKSGGSDVPVHRAVELVYGYAAGVDLTRRDLQTIAKDAGGPWDSAKGFDASAPCGVIRPANQVGELQGRIAIAVNGATKQDGKLSDMIWNVSEVIAQCSRLWTLQAGDLIFTGTPDGVGPLQRGDGVKGEIEGVGAVEFVVS